MLSRQASLWIVAKFRVCCDFRSDNIGEMNGGWSDSGHGQTKILVSDAEKAKKPKSQKGKEAEMGLERCDCDCNCDCLPLLVSLRRLLGLYHPPPTPLTRFQHIQKNGAKRQGQVQRPRAAL